MTVETWIPIPGLRDYEASTDGRIRRATSRTNTVAGRVLRGSRDKGGYIRVKLSGRTRAFAHRLVALAFHGPSEKPHVNHINGVKTDNRPENLEYVTAAENQAHASRLGLLASGDRHPARTTSAYRDRLVRFRSEHPERMARGERVNTAKLTANQVWKIRAEYSTGFSQQAIAAAFGVTQSEISDIVRRTHWKHV